MRLDNLARIFAKLGAPGSEIWARSQVDDGIPQLARFLFLRQAWRGVVAEDATEWITRSFERATRHPDEPYAGVGHALRNLRALGARDHDITDLVRGMQVGLLFSLCYLLEDPGLTEPEVADMQWALVQVDEEGNVLSKIGGLHESVLETDPTGRKMRPRSAG